MAEVPITLAARKNRKTQRSPQDNIDEFWSKFTTKAPGKGMCFLFYSSFVIDC